MNTVFVCKPGFFQFRLPEILRCNDRLLFVGETSNWVDPFAWITRYLIRPNTLISRYIALTNSQLIIAVFLSGDCGNDCEMCPSGIDKIERIQHCRLP